MNGSRAGRSRPARLLLAIAASAMAATLPSALPAQAIATAASGQGLEDFYAKRGDRPLWFGAEARGSEPEILLALLRTADADGLDPTRFDVWSLERTVRIARLGRPEDIARADRLLSRAFVDYVRALRQVPDVEILWVDSDLRPTPPSASVILERAAAAPSLADYLKTMRWMNPVYASLRTAMANGEPANAEERAKLRLNIARARALPEARGRYILVNAAAARLTMYEDDRVVDSMKVVVGKPIYPTPMMAARIKYASLNPYWNVPPDLAAERIAPGVVKEGISYLTKRGYQVLSSWGSDAQLIDPTSIDWKAVADGKVEVRIRQLPGPGNSMGQMKFMFPNKAGVYLHDTPQKELLSESTRLFSGGCVRLEDAARLGKWLFGAPLHAKGEDPDQRIDLDEKVPVYITYLTAMPADGHIAYYPDPYNRDRSSLAVNAGGSRVAGR